MAPKAIGLLHLDVIEPGIDGKVVINAIAGERGYEVADVVTINAQTFMPVTHIMHTAAQRHATAIVAPDLSHFGGAAIVHALAKSLPLVTQSGTVPQSGERAVR